MARGNGPRITPRAIERRNRARRIVAKLQKAYPDARCSLNFSSPLELIVATILSAQCTDERVNKVTPELFRRCPDAHAYASVPPVILESLIQSTGFFRNKSKSIRAMAQSLLDSYGGEVPRTMDELTALAGVGRKTANVVLGNAFGINVGVTVDTHVTRLSQRLGFTKHNDPVKIETDLMPLVDQSDWALFSHLLIFHGRAICRAQRPQCLACVLRPDCPSAAKFIRLGKAAGA